MKRYDESAHLKRNVGTGHGGPNALGLPISLMLSAPPGFTFTERGMDRDRVWLLLGVLQRVDACTDLQGRAQLHVHCAHEMVFF